MKKNSNKKTWKKTHRQHKVSKMILWKFKLSEKSEEILRKYCLENNIGLKRGFTKIIKEYLDCRDSHPELILDKVQ